MLRLGIAIFVLSCMWMPSPARGWSIWSRATDDSVCDMGPRTLERLAQRQFVSTYSPNQPEIFLRLAIRRILDNCKDGQTLLVNTETASPLDNQVLIEVANVFCWVDGVERHPISATGIAPGHQPTNGFELRCKITKMSQASTWYKDAETKKSTDTMIQEGYALQDKATSGEPAVENAQPDKDCSKVTLTTLLFGGSCE